MLLVAGKLAQFPPSADEHGMQVWLMRPVALDQQARELLRAGAVEAALQLALVCFDQGDAWADIALVEVALLLIQGALASTYTSRVFHREFSAVIHGASHEKC